MSITFHLEDNTAAMNVCNRNARVILHIVTGMDLFVDDFYGELEPDQILAAFSVQDLRQFLIPDTDNQGIEISFEGVKDVPRIISQGLRADQLERYRDTLTDMALMAKATGQKIIFD
jgi:hypothetical protein